MHNCLAVCLLLLLVGMVQAADDSLVVNESLESRVQQLVLELDAPQLAQRNAAEQALQELGEEALTFLPTAGTTLPPEVTKRVERLRVRIAKSSATKSASKKAKDIQLGNAATLGEALEAISRDSGIEFDDVPNAEQRITPFGSPLPFWHAVDYVLDQTDLDIDFYSGEAGVISLRPRAENRPSRVDSAAYAGIYRLEPVIVTSRRVLRDASLSGMSVELEVSWKPDAHPLGITLPFTHVLAKLDDGATVGSPELAGAIDIAPSNEVATSTIQVPLDLPAGRPTKIVSLSGKIVSMLPGETKQFDFPLKIASQTQTVDSVTVNLEDVRKNGPLHEVRLGVEFKSPGKAMESHRGWLLSNEVYVSMPDGSRQDHLGYELYRHNETGVGIGYLFDVGDTPGEAKLVYKTPTAVVENEIDFVIQDIQMP